MDRSADSWVLVAPANLWPIWAMMVAGVAFCVWLEARSRWAAKMSGPVLLLAVGMILSNCRILPAESPAYGIVDDYLVPVAIPLLLFRANLGRILRETGPLFLAFHVSAVGTVFGAFLAAGLFHGAFPSWQEVCGIMTGSYIGGGVNFVGVKNTYQVSANLANPLLVADNFIMAGMFALLLVMAGSRFFRRHFPHPHSLAGDQVDARALAAEHWKRKEVGLSDITQALAIAFVVTAFAMMLSAWLKGKTDSRFLQSVVGNPFVFITLFTVLAATAWHRWLDRIRGAEELGVFLLYLFFLVIGLRADLLAVIREVPVLFVFCLTMAVTNLIFSLVAGKLLRLNLEDLLISVNATLGGAPSAAAMAVSLGWSRLILPGMLVAIWGYVIGTLVGIAVTETLIRLSAAG